MFHFVKKYPEKVGSTAPPRSKKWVDINTKLQEFINAYNNNQYYYYDNYIQFLSAVSSILF